MSATLLGLVALAHAQSPRVDPAYLAYLDALDAIDGQMDVFPPPFAQLDWGVVTLWGSAPGAAASIRVQWLDDHHAREEYFFHPGFTFAPGAGFTFQHTGTDTLVLDEDWEGLPYIRMDVHYVPYPTPVMWQVLDAQGAENQIDHWTFELRQALVPNGPWKIVGWLHREHHHVDGAEEQYVDHWSFTDVYDMPSVSNPRSVAVSLSSVQHDTAADYFAWLETQDVDVPVHAQVTYQVGIGADLLP